MIVPSNAAEELGQLRRMRLVSVVEGCTLLILVFVAVPIKHLGGHAIATTIIGPIHGMAFLLYIWTLIQTVSGADFARPDVVRMVVAAFFPFGAFLNERALRRRQALLASG
jgi:integral membrane protein